MNIVPLYQKQTDFLDCPARFAAFCGGIGSGKSFVLCYNRVRNLRPGGLYMILSPTYPMLRDATLRSFFDVCHRVNSPYEYYRTESRVQFTRTGAEVLFRSADNPESLRGPNLAGVDMDEASLMSRSVYDISIGRLRQGSEVGALRAAFTPKGPNHWTHEVFATGKPDTAIFRARTSENPFLPQEFEEIVSRQYGDTQFARQELGGEFVQLAGAEFPAEWFDYPGFWFERWPEQLALRVLYLDPSKGRTDRPGDYQAFVLAALVREPTAVANTYTNVVYLDAVLGHEPVPAMIARGLRICKEWQPVSVWGIEDNGTMGFLDPEVQRQLSDARQLQAWVPITNHEPKVQRVRELGGYLSRRQVRIRNTPGGRLLRAQLGDFPAGEHDDGPDAAAGAMRLLEQLTNGM